MSPMLVVILTRWDCVAAGGAGSAARTVGCASSTRAAAAARMSERVERPKRLAHGCAGLGRVIVMCINPPSLGRSRAHAGHKF